MGCEAGKDRVGGTGREACPTKATCPNCGTDVMVTGFDIYTDRKIMYMRFSAGVGSVAVADRERPDVHCAACHAVLPWTAAELRAA